MSQSHETTRKFGFWSAHFVVVASMIGAGILTTSGFTLRETGNPPALLGLWLIGGCMALAGAVTVAELATMMPRAGGDYLYVREGYGPAAGFVCGWSTFILGFAAPTAVVALTASNYLLAFLSEETLSQLPKPILEYRYAGLASLFIAGITVGHCFGHRQSAFIQVFSTIIKLAILVAIALLGLLLGRGNWQYLSYGGTPTYAQLPALGIGLIYISYAYSGWNGASYLAGEVRNPRALLPRALISGCLVVIVLYLTLNLAFVYALDPVEMQTLPIEQVARVAELAASSLFGSYISVPLSTLLGLTLVASLSAYLLAGPRVLYAFAQDGFFFRAFGRLHPRWEVPVAATLLQGLLAMVFVWSGTFLQLLDYTSVGLAALSGLTVAAVFPLRRKLKGVDAYRMPWFPLPPLIYLGLICWIVTQALLQPDRRWSTILSLGTIALGLLPGLLKFGKVHR